MSRVVVVAEYRDKPSEGMQVVSKTIVDALRGAGHTVRVIEPRDVPKSLPTLVREQPRAVVFTHGPGWGVVAYSWFLRKALRGRVIWVACRPDVGSPRWLRPIKSAHFVVCNRRRPDLEAVARDAEFVEQFIGIDPARVAPRDDEDCPWPDLVSTRRPIVLHVGHLKRNRGLEALAQTKRSLGDKVEIVVQGGPALPPDAGVVEELESAGVHVRRDFESNLYRLYRAADLYVFPVAHEALGAIELPLGVLEAIACQTPVLCTNFGVLRQALHGIAGVTFCDQSNLVSVLSELLETGALARKPPGLPHRLHSDRVTELVLRIIEEKPCIA